jgi:hypothetical protein
MRDQATKLAVVVVFTGMGAPGQTLFGAAWSGVTSSPNVLMAQWQGGGL